MGAYVYRVTAKQVTCSDGKKANIAVFAYKPSFGWDGEKQNSRFHFRSGATASDAMAARGNITNRIVYGDENGVPYPENVFENTTMVGSFYDSHNGMKKIEGVTVK